STTKWLKRVATIAQRAPRETTRLPSITRVVVIRLLSYPAHRVQRNALDDVQSIAVDPGNLTRTIGQQADLVHAEIDEHLRSEAELAQRCVVGRQRCRHTLHLTHGLELAAKVAPRSDV